MQEIDRLGWAAGLTFESYGVIVGIRTTSATVLPRIEALLPPESKRVRLKRVEILYSLLAPTDGRPGIKRFNILYLGAARVARSFKLEEILETLGEGLLATLATSSRETIFLNGGAVEIDGRAIVIAGPKGSGRTSLVKAFLKAGARYYSDDYALIDETGKVHPFQVPLSGVQGTWRTFRGATPRPIGCVVVTRYREGARFRPRLLSAGQAMLELLSNAAPLRLHPRVVMARMRRVVSTTPVLKGVRGEADEVVARILASLEWNGTRS
jgi:hypothetical protein